MQALDTRLRKRIQVSLYALLFLTGLLALSVLLEGCTDRCETSTQYTYFKPVYTSIATLRASAQIEDARTLEETGKIYIKDNWLFVNAPGKGIHIIDNTDPAAPVNKSFLAVPGNWDLAVKGNALYADSFIDLVVFDISNINQIREVERLENVFQSYNSLGFYVDPTQGLVTEWVEDKKVEVYESDCEANVQAWGGILFNEGVAFADASSFKSSAAIAPGNGSGPGVGGSMARFTINADHLYVIDGGAIETFSLANEAAPQSRGEKQISWDMETVFPYNNHLFIGSQTGMHIVSLADPTQPALVSTYTHVRVCDPVVVKGDLAYVTLRSGNQCAGFTNQLEVIDVKDYTKPTILHTYSMTNPHGLGIDNKKLFICDGSAGLKIYDATDIAAIDKNLLAQYPSIGAYDVIPYNGTLIMVAKDGIFQYDYSNPKNIKLLSHIVVSNAN